MNRQCCVNVSRLGVTGSARYFRICLEPCKSRESRLLELLWHGPRPDDLFHISSSTSYGPRYLLARGVAATCNGLSRSC